MPLNKALFEYDSQLLYANDIRLALEQVGIQKSDSIFVHSDLKHFGKLSQIMNRDEFFGQMIDVFLNVIGPNGNLMMPTFSYSFCKGEIFDVLETPSAVGVLTEAFRRTSGIQRSIDPIFSVAAIGPKKDFFTDVSSECFGKNSIFDKLYQSNVKLIFFGPTFDITYAHYIENRFGVPYRYMKSFPGILRVGGNHRAATFHYYVRDLEIDPQYDLEKIADILNTHAVLRKVHLGMSIIRSVTAQDAYRVLFEELKKDPYCLLSSTVKGRHKRLER